MSASTNSSFSAVQMTAEDQVQQIELLTSTDDDHGGVIVEMDESMDSTIFISILRASISHWKQLGKKGVWIKLPIHLVSLVEALVKEGFWYHHAEPKYLMLVYWIPEGANTIPGNATHQVGVGALVVNEKREVLVVQEKSGHFQGTGAWKFPTGVVDQGEDICVAAVREVKEETGVSSLFSLLNVDLSVAVQKFSIVTLSLIIPSSLNFQVDSEFMEVLAFRQSHMTFFEKSDLFFVCMLRPLSFDIQIQEIEIEAAQWMPFDEYAAQPIMEKYELLKYVNDIYLAKIDGRYSGFTPVSTTSNFSEGKSYLYLNAGGLKRCNSL
ncbi:nudix hydrolase 2-like isoform X1 [Gastrolobium bilobum]|uniref:nudix hydrolase 2-like isoform X1 n=1 Tax=Gastrolobium bilobum TaxID=150636 RepID=UPI002AB0E76D|nr:nudix hydrolase 2-like isoform X1 [Gastrolobium bilobum]XP_061339775.1 nudix hydrolase 2-like isoform X1 [Gastrolobium bilobum]XP_061339776.1 nudix hydrolase 2-like isoform X1 [Gastrolobium bilobum]